MFPGSAHWLLSADGFVAVCLGGASYFAGPIVGAAVLKLVSLALPRFTEYWMFFLGIVILLVAMLRPAGLLSLVRQKSERS
jgi:ABC-type branched-subunit amino acid transport system permease subunit